MRLNRYLTTEGKEQGRFRTNIKVNSKYNLGQIIVSD